MGRHGKQSATHLVVQPPNCNVLLSRETTEGPDMCTMVVIIIQLAAVMQVQLICGASLRLLLLHMTMRHHMLGDVGRQGGHAAGSGRAVASGCASTPL